MLRRAALLLCLAAPLGAGAQTLTISPVGPFGLKDCLPATTGYVDPTFTLSWTVVPTGTGGFGANDVYRISATTQSTCPTDDTGLIDTISASSATGAYPLSGGTLKLSTVIAKAATSCSGTADVTVGVCVALRRSAGTTNEVVVRNTFKLQLKPPLAPTSLSVSSGSGALNLTWKAPDSTSDPAATQYVYTVSTSDPLDPVVHTDTVGGSPVRVSPLVNGVLYDVSVVALSAGGNASPAVTGTGTPQVVNDFFTQYVADGGTEQGGCAGGPAGLLSLLGLGAVVRAFRRRS